MGASTLTYGSSSNYTITLASLAADATLLTGRESTAVSNTTTLAFDYIIGGQIMTGTSPTAGVIEVWAYAGANDTPLYPDVFDGTDSAETASSTDVKFASLRLVASITTGTTSNFAYPISPVSLRSLFGCIPKNHGLFVTHSTVAALNATGGNHILSYTPTAFTSV